MQNSKNDFSLRKSKSYNGPDSKYYQNNFEETNLSCKNQTYEFSIKNLNCFPEDINNMAKHIVKGINNTKTSIPTINTYLNEIILKY